MSCRATRTTGSDAPAGAVATIPTHCSTRSTPATVVATGVGPYSGQAVHFRHFAPEKVPYGVERYTFEAKRHFGILDAHLAGQRYLVGDTYTIADMNLWGWARMLPFILGDDAVASLPHVKRLVDEISARPAAQRALALKDRFPFKAEMDAEARKHMFKHLGQPAA